MVDAGALIAIVTGILGLAGIVFTALKFNRDDTTSIVSQQSGVLKDMATLNDDLRATVSDLRSERDQLRGEVQALHEQVQRLTDELRRLTA